MIKTGPTQTTRPMIMLASLYRVYSKSTLMPTKEKYSVKAKRPIRKVLWLRK